MSKLIDKLFILGLSILLLTASPVTVRELQFFLLALILSAASSYFEHWRLPWAAFVYLGAALFLPSLSPALPLFAYDLGFAPGFYPLLSLLPFIRIFQSAPLSYVVPLLIFTLLALFLQRRTASVSNLLQLNHNMRDASAESNLRLQKANRELIEKQDYEIRVATLTERNRIAREIHDNVGHLLTRSILQMSALEVLHKSEPQLTEELSMVKATLTDAMDSIRKSVHDLHEESVDLEVTLIGLIEEFTFCPVHLQYAASEMPKELKYSMIAIAKEALSNIARHSNATRAQISVLEHPALYQLIIEDNGTAPSSEDSSGIGLDNIRDRVAAFSGIFRIDHTNGFRLFISIPKEHLS